MQKLLFLFYKIIYSGEMWQAQLADLTVNAIEDDNYEFLKFCLLENSPLVFQTCFNNIGQICEMKQSDYVIDLILANYPKMYDLDFERLLYFVNNPKNIYSFGSVISYLQHRKELKEHSSEDFVFIYKRIMNQSLSFGKEYAINIFNILENTVHKKIIQKRFKQFPEFDFIFLKNKIEEF